MSGVHFLDAHSGRTNRGRRLSSPENPGFRHFAAVPSGHGSRLQAKAEDEAREKAQEACGKTSQDDKSGKASLAFALSVTPTPSQSEESADDPGNERYPVLTMLCFAKI
jgi:hypothetical protein